MLKEAQLVASEGEAHIEAEFLSFAKLLTKGFPDITCLDFASFLE